MDCIYDRMKDDVDDLAASFFEKSEIRQFYAGQTILLTGATGYLGKLAVEKLLRSCPEVKKIFILVRPIKGLSVSEISANTYKNMVFDVLRKQRPNFEDVIVPIEGDLEKHDLGLSADDQRRIEREVDIILHNGANTKLDKKISVALKTNVLATQTLLGIAQNCQKLKVFMYMSTAYSHCHQQVIDEKFYSPPLDMKMVHDIIKSDTENETGVTEEAMKVLRGNWPNNYLLTKSFAEELVRQCGQRSKFACGVFRPSIVLSTYKEPLKGWFDDRSTAMKLFTYVMLGAIHTSPYAGHPGDVIPADMCTNAFLASTWHTFERQKQASQENSARRALVYNYASTAIKPITVSELWNEINKIASNDPLPGTLWKPFLVLCNYFWLFLVLHVLFHGIPAVLADVVLLLVKGQKPKLTPLFWKATKHAGAIRYFTMGNWKIHIQETMNMCDRMNSMDKDLFYCDFRNFDWGDCIPNIYHGMRTYFLKDSSETAERNDKTKYLFNVAHYGLCSIILYLFVTYMMNLF